MAGNHLHDLALVVDDLERMGRVARIASEVDLRHDLAGIAAKLEGGPRLALFEKVKGSAYPVVAGLYWNRALLADLMRQHEADLPQFISRCIKKWQREPVDPVVVKSGPVLDVTETDVDLGTIPIPIHALKDGGPYLDAAVVIAKDPETGVRNASIQRFQVAGRDALHVNIDAGRHLETYLDKARKLGRSLWLTLNCSVGPGLHFAAATPAEAAPIERDELGIASEFHGAPLELVPGTESDCEMAAHAMWALECEIVPGELAPEGPFAEVTNYYAKVEPRPVVYVRRIHRRARPIFQTILSGIEVWNSVGLLGEANVLALLQQQVPGVRDVYFSHGGCGFYHAVVQLQQMRAGWSKQAILAAFAAFPPLKMVTVVDDDVDIRNAQDVEWAMATRFDPAAGLVRIEKAFGHGLNPSFPDYLGPKIGFDATQPFPKQSSFERASYKAMALDRLAIAAPEIRRPRLQLKVVVPEPAAPKPSASEDFDIDRIWRRELEQWQNEKLPKGTGKAEVTVQRKAASRPAEAAVPMAATGKDWDESRWWQREMAEMAKEKAERETKRAHKAAAAVPRLDIASAPVPARIAPRPPRPAAVADDDDGGFFRGGGM